MSLKKLVILVSGSGSNLQAIMDQVQNKSIPAEIVAVIANKPCYGLERAQKANIPAKMLAHKAYPSRGQYDQALIKVIDQYHPDFVILSGFMRILTPEFVSHYQDRLINIHPALLPKFKGLHTHQRALEAGEQWHGSTVHVVTEGVDEGAIIAQAKIQISQGDSADTLEEKVKALEHRLYPQVIQKLCEGSVTIKAGQVLQS